MKVKNCFLSFLHFSPDFFNRYCSSSNKLNDQIKQGKLSKESYVPDGLTKAQYEKQRNKDTAAVASNYKKNVAKAGKFLDYTQFYIDRGTDVKDNWYKSVTNGHRMAKTKYDFSGTVDDAPKQTGVEAKPKRKLFGKKQMILKLLQKQRLASTY